MSGGYKVYSVDPKAPVGPPSAERLQPTSIFVRLRQIVNGIYCDDRRLQFLLLALMLLLYGSLLWISGRLTPGERLDLTFNSMLEHLLHGRFDVDPDIVGVEGFSREGRIYVYWGIWCALVRLPLWILRRMDSDVTVWSCLAAVCVAGMAKVRVLILVRRHSPQGAAIDWAIALMLAYILLGGSQVGYLRISVYQEVIFWAYAFATIFVYLAMKGVIYRCFDLGTLSGMALCAGLALLTRVSTAMGLLLAMALLLLLLIVQSGKVVDGERSVRMRPIWRGLAQRRVLIPLGILVVLIAVTGIVNYYRWGNPTTFANYDLYLANRHVTDGLPHIRIYHTFNPTRIPFSLLYYIVPVWALHGSHGQFLLTQTQAKLFARVEVPPSSFLLTDLLPICFIFLLAVGLWRRRSVSLSHVGQWAAVLAIGLLLPCILMLSYISMSYRYRMDFYPEMDLLAFTGLYASVTDATMLPLLVKCRGRILVALVVSVASSFAALAMYDLALSTLTQPHTYYHKAVQQLYRLIGSVVPFH